MNWREKGACRDLPNDMFFPIRSELGNKKYDAAVEQAVAVCEGCPVRQRCEQELDENEYGIWGGIDARSYHAT